MNAEKHYVIVPNLQRFRDWAHENLTEWHERGHGVIVTRTGVYRAVTALHQLRGATFTKDRLHYTDDWHVGLTGRAALEMENYIDVCISLGEDK